MSYLFQALSLLLTISVIYCNAKSTEQMLGKCSYFGGLHLIPFAVPSHPIQNQYICRPTGQEVLISNRDLEILVTMNPNGIHSIVEYRLTFFATDGYPSFCTIIDNTLDPVTRPLACPGDSPVKTIQTSSSVHYIHRTRNIQVDIDNQGFFFDISVRQSSELIAQSQGICVNWQCSFETVPSSGKRRYHEYIPVLSRVCQIFIEAARKHALNPIDRRLVISRQVSCTFDLRTTLDQRYARTIITSMLRENVRGNQTDDRVENYLLMIDTIAQKTIEEAHSLADEHIRDSAPICQADATKLRCLEAIRKSETNT